MFELLVVLCLAFIGIQLAAIADELHEFNNWAKAETPDA